MITDILLPKCPELCESKTHFLTLSYQGANLNLILEYSSPPPDSSGGGREETRKVRGANLCPLPPPVGGDPGRKTENLDDQVW